MAKKKSPKIVRTEPVCYDPPAFTAEEQQTIYKRDYEFNKRSPARAPVEGWNYKYINENSPFSRIPQQEVNLVKGTPHTFKHVRTNNPYTRNRPAMKRNKSR